jgi:hypothetical protein
MILSCLQEGIFRLNLKKGWVTITGDSFEKGFSPIPMDVTLTNSQDKPLVKGSAKLLLDLT